MKRNPFFMPSGFTDEEIHDINERVKAIRAAEKEVRARKRREQKWQNLLKFKVKPDWKERFKKQPHHSIFKNTSEQIQRGFDTAKRWEND
jgi:hypothetical protein